MDTVIEIPLVGFSFLINQLDNVVIKLVANYFFVVKHDTTIIGTIKMKNTVLDTSHIPTQL